MIIFDLDGTLANCEHRRHFVDGNKSPILKIGEEFDKKDLWKPDWKSFNKLCDQDKPIRPVMNVFKNIFESRQDKIMIWTSRCESVREKTLDWLIANLQIYGLHKETLDEILTMRSIGDLCSSSDLKKGWFEGNSGVGGYIECVYESDKECSKMWNENGIFVFDCCQYT